MTMSMTKNAKGLERAEANGYVVVGAHIDSMGHAWMDLAHPDRTCLHPMREWWAPTPEGTVRAAHWGGCLLDKGHRGRHSTVVYNCDACGKMRRGEPYRSDEEGAYCFMCVATWSGEIEW